MTTPKIRITPRQFDVIRLASQGKSSWVIARILGISEHTVNYHKKAVMTKCNTSNLMVCIVQLVRAGQI